MKLDRVFVSPFPVARRPPQHSPAHQLLEADSPGRRGERSRHGNVVDGFDAAPGGRRAGGGLRHLIKLIRALAAHQPPKHAIPDPRVPTTGSATGGGDSFTPAPPMQSAPAPVSPRCGTPNGGSSSAPNPFLDGKGMSLNANGYQFAKAGPDMTWEQLAQLFAERKVSANTSGSCGMTQAERSESLREFWDQCVASGKKPSECSFNLLCAPGAPPPGIVAG